MRWLSHHLPAPQSGILHPSPCCPGVLVGPLALIVTSSAEVSRLVKAPSDLVALMICTSLMLLISVSSLAGGSIRRKVSQYGGEVLSCRPPVVQLCASL